MFANRYFCCLDFRRAEPIGDEQGKTSRSCRQGIKGNVRFQITGSTAEDARDVTLVGGATVEHGKGQGVAVGITGGP